MGVKLWPGRLDSKFGWDSCIFGHRASSQSAADNVKTRSVHTMSRTESPCLVLVASIPSQPLPFPGGFDILFSESGECRTVELLAQTKSPHWRHEKNENSPPMGLRQSYILQPYCRVLISANRDFKIHGYCRQ